MSGWALGLVVLQPGLVSYAPINAAVQATLPVASFFSANAAGGVSVGAALSTKIPLNANCNGGAIVTVTFVTGGQGWARGTVFLTPGMVAYANGGSAVAASLVSSFIALVANAAGGASVSASLTTAGTLAASPVMLSGASASLTTGIALAARPVVSSSFTGVLHGSSAALAVTAVVTFAAPGGLTTRIVLRSTASTGATVGASLNTGSLLAAMIDAFLSASASLTTGIPLLASVQSGSAVIANLSTRGIISAAAQAACIVAAPLSTKIICASVAVASSNCSPTLSTGIPLGANCNGEAFGLGSLSAPGTAVGMYTLDPDWVVTGRRTQFTQRLNELAPGEEVILAFYFGDDLQNGEQLLGRVTVSVTVSAGTDPNGTATLSGPPSYDSSQTMLLQPITGQLAGCDYYLEVTAPTSNPFKVLSRFGLLPVRS